MRTIRTDEHRVADLARSYTVRPSTCWLS